MYRAASKNGAGRSRRKFDEPKYLKRLFAAGARASTLGIAILDSETRFESVNAALARETRAPANDHIGRTSREVVGDLAKQIEPTYEKVLRTGKPASVSLKGCIRDTPEYGYWLDHCFPTFNRAGRVEQLGLFVVNVTAEKALREMLDALGTDATLVGARAAGIIDRFDQSIRHFHSGLKMGFQELASSGSEPARKADHFRSSVEEMDNEINVMRELIYEFISRLAIPRC